MSRRQSVSSDRSGNLRRVSSSIPDDETGTTYQLTIDNLRYQLDELRLDFKKSKEWHRFELQETQHKLDKLKEKIRLDEEAAQQDYAEEYQKLIDEIAPDEINLEYVYTLQRKLVKAFQKMENKDAQMKSQRDMYEELLASSRKEAEQIIHEKSKAEMRLLKQISEQEKERRAAAERYEAELKGCREGLESTEEDSVIRSAAEMFGSHKQTSSTPMSVSVPDYNPIQGPELCEEDSPSTRTHSWSLGTGKGLWKTLQERRSSVVRAMENDTQLDSAFYDRLKAKDERIAQLQEELYKKDRMIIEWKRTTEDSIFDEILGGSRGDMRKKLCSEVYDSVRSLMSTSTS